MGAAEPLRQVLLELPPAGGHRRKPPRANLSALALRGRSVFLGTDEGTVLDRLSLGEDGKLARHAAFPLQDLLDLPITSGEGDEIDIEGLEAEEDRLWLVGSHSRTRGKPKDDPINELADLKHNPNRHVLACLPLVPDGAGGHGLAPQGTARLPIGKKRGELAKALKHDPHLKPFFRLPAKENGFDIEGVAALGQRLFLGLRGPVLRGIALILEIEVAEAGDGLLALRPIGPDGRACRKHFLDLGGNGVRDLHREGEDILILSGPTADIDGHCTVWRWRDPFAIQGDSFLADGKRLRRLLRLPVGEEADHPEGFALLPGTGGRELLVVYDAPAKERCRGKGAVLADVFALPAP